MSTLICQWHKQKAKVCLFCMLNMLVVITPNDKDLKIFKLVTIWPALDIWIVS